MDLMYSKPQEAAFYRYFGIYSSKLMFVSLRNLCIRAGHLHHLDPSHGADVCDP